MRFSKSNNHASRAAEPRHQPFDPWVSVAAGHQVAETSVGTGWRAARQAKLAGQFSGGSSGGETAYDAVGKGAQHYDEKLGGIVTPDVRALAMSNVRDMLIRPGLMKKSGALRDSEETGNAATSKSPLISRTVSDLEQLPSQASAAGGAAAEKAMTERKGAEGAAGKRLFEGVNVYVNGSTFPLVSDHKLKHLMAEHGGQVSLHLGRRAVTHVIIGRSAGRAGGAGGGLAGGKLEKEIRKAAGASVKFVNVEW